MRRLCLRLLPMVLPIVLVSCGTVEDDGASVAGEGRDPGMPLAENHAHIRSAAGGALLLRIAAAVGQDMGDDDGSEIGADRLIAVMDSIGVQRAQVLSVAYFHGFPDFEMDEREAGTRSENDWVAEQVARFPGRLYGACSVNPVDDWAPAEVQRCADDPRLSGLKLHFANSDVDLRNPEHVARLANVFGVAAENDLPIVAHIRTRHPEYGAADVEALIAEVLAAAPGLPVQFAHMAGWGGYDAATDAALGAFIAAFETGSLDRALYTFDLAAVAVPPSRAAPDSTLMREVMAWNDALSGRIRELGLDRVVFATDWSALDIGEYAASLQGSLSLSVEELHAIFGNVGPMITQADGVGR